MTHRCITGLMTAVLIAASGGVVHAAEAPATPAAAAADIPEVKPAAPGVFTVKKAGPARLHLVLAAHAFTTPDDAEKYLAYRAAETTLEQGFTWFSFVEQRAKGDTVPVPKSDPQGPRYSYRLEYFRPVWRYQTAGAPAWKSWSPFSGAPSWATGIDPKTVTNYEVTADIVLHKGEAKDDDPLAFDAGALHDFLINQVEPPK